MIKKLFIKCESSINVSVAQFLSMTYLQNITKQFFLHLKIYLA